MPEHELRARHELSPYFASHFLQKASIYTEKIYSNSQLLQNSTSQSTYCGIQALRLLIKKNFLRIY